MKGPTYFNENEITISETNRYKLTSNGYDGQMELTPSGDVIDPAELNAPKPMVINEDGSAAVDTSLAEVPPKIGSNDFLQLIASKPEEAVNYICSLQSNNSPAKRGGVNITYRPEILFLRSRQNYTLYENNIMDILLAEMSSKPDNRVYEIPVKELDERLGYSKGSKQGYKVFKKALPLLKEKVIMEFNLPVADGMHTFRFPWYLALDEFIPKEGEAGENKFTFQPSPFFEAFAKASGILHGAYYSTQLLSQISAEYSRNVFYLLETYKKYRAYPGGPIGEVEFALDELKFYLGMPVSYKAGDIKRVLERARRDLEGIENIDISFTFTEHKQGRKIVGYLFHISDIYAREKGREIAEKAVVDIEDKHKDLYVLLTDFGLNEEEAKSIIETYINYNRTLMDVMKSITSINSMKNPRSKYSLLKTKLVTGEFEYNAPEKNEKPKNGFHNFQQRDYDMDDLEKKLLGQ